MRALAVAWLLIAVTAATGADPDAEWVYPVTYKGKPVVGVKVGMVTTTYPTPGEPKAGDSVFATTDAKGEARFPKAATPAPTVFARFLSRDANGRGGYGLIFGTGAGEIRKHPPTIELRENGELTGRVTDAEGKPVPGLKLKPVALGPDSFARAGGRAYSLADTPDWFWEKFPAKVAADGAFALAGVPLEHSVAMRFEAPEFGTGRFWVRPGTPTTIALQKAGEIRVTFTAPASAKPGDVRLTATRSAPDFLEATVEGTAKAGGPVTLADLPPGQYAIGFPYTGPAALFPGKAGTVIVKAGQTTEVTVPLEPAARVIAKLVDSKTGAGVPGAKVTLGITRGSSDYISVTDAKVDADGKVELLVPAGMVTLYPRAANGYAVLKFGNNPFNTSATDPVPVAAGKAHDFGSFALVKTVELSGVVVDEADKPVAGASVSVGYSGSNSGAARGKTDAEGRFVVTGLNPEGGVVGLTARGGKRITAAPVAVDPGKPEGEVRMVVSEKYGAKVRVRAVDRAGKPLEAVGVELMHSVTYLYRGPILGSGTGGRVGATAADGRFESDVLQPGDRYSLTLSAHGFRAVTLADWTAKLGETHNYGDVVFTRSDLTVSGTVTDLGGKPVAGATVFDNSDGPKPVETKTDAAGRFTLGGLFEGPAFVSVRAEGFKLASVAAVPGGPAVTVTLRKPSDPPAPPPTIPAEHKTATEKLTRHLLEAMWKNRVAAGDDGVSTVRAMARLDPATARKWRDEEKARSDGKVDLTTEIATVERERSLLKTAREDADEAIALLKPLEGIEGFRAVCALAGELFPTAPDKAPRVAEEAVARARGLEEAERAWGLAQAGELVWRAGKKDAGKKVIEEAAKLAAPLGFADLDGYRRGMVACRVALYDAAACRAMIDPMKSASDFNRWLAQAAPRLAEHDLPLAKKWLGQFRPDNTYAPHSAAQRMAYRVVRTHPDEAVAIAKGIENINVRVETLAGLAVRTEDKVRAAKLIDAAIDEYLARSGGYYSGGAAGVILYRAKQLDYPDLAALRDKAVATRSADAGRANGPDVRDALALAITDPATARQLLAARLLPGDLTKVENRWNREALLATALADPTSVVPVVDELIAAAVKRKTGFDGTGLETLASVFSQPDRLADAALSVWYFEDFKEE